MTSRMSNATHSALNIGDRLAQVRSLRGLSLPQVEKKTGGALDRAAVSRIEAGKTSPSLMRLLAFAVAYDMDILIRRDGTIDIRGTRLAELAEAKLRARLPKEGTK